MYLDLDLHHSDAVSQAFAGSTSGLVLTMSIHHAAPGFYPASPSSSLSDPQTCDPYTLSLPLKRGASDKTFRRIWQCVELVRCAFRPDYIVLQCGADGLAGDPCAIWNWSLGSSEGSFGWCISQALSWKCKTLLLGGGDRTFPRLRLHAQHPDLEAGGYHSQNTARAWSYATFVAVSVPQYVIDLV
jgi:histone deacetylase 8